MKLLFEESLSPRLVPLLSDLFPDSESALRLNRSTASVSERGRRKGYVWVSFIV